ncbi:hypothetical protein ONZ45_g4366 [Pleurotus djamor]|nr:hypothetical protein ONZ45_g4366 [Pleurotus djamor]
MFSASNSPIHRLPVELITRIFIEGVAVDYPYAHSPFLFKPNQPTYREHDLSIRTPNFQLLVSHVCRQWREIALNTACLWTTIHFSRPGHMARAREYIRRCLPPINDPDRYRKSPTQLIDIMVDTVSPDECRPGLDLCKDHFDDVFDIIMPHVTLWRAFHLKVRDDACKLLARKHLCSAEAGPHLESLQLYHFEAFREARDLYIATYRPPVIIFHNKLPRLRNVSLIGVNLNWAGSNHLHTLDHLQLALHSDNIRPPYERFAAMLRDSPSLQTLSLHYSGPKNNDGTPSHIWGTHYDTIDLPCLYDLTLIDLDPGYLYAVMERLRVPCLRKLTLELSQQDLESSERDYSSFLDLIVNGKEIRMPGAISQQPLVVQPNGHPPVTAAPQTAPGLPSLISSTPPATSPSSSSSPPSQPVLPTPSQAASNTEASSNPSAVATTSTSPTTHRLRPLPNLSTNITHLIISALDCSLASWRSLLRALNATEHLDVDFERLTSTRSTEVNEELEDQPGNSLSPEMSAATTTQAPNEESGAFFKAVFEDRFAPTTLSLSSRETSATATPLSSPSSSRHSSKRSSRSSSLSRRNEEDQNNPEPLLPKLKTFKMSGVSGALIKEFIIYREGGWLRRAHGNLDLGLGVSGAKISGSSSSSTVRTFRLTRVEMRRFALERYIVRRGMVADDEVLDDLVDHGCWVASTDLPCQSRGFSYEDADGDGEEDEEVKGWLVKVEEEISEDIDEEDDDDEEDEAEGDADSEEDYDDEQMGAVGHSGREAIPYEVGKDVQIKEDWSGSEDTEDGEDY